MSKWLLYLSFSLAISCSPGNNGHKSDPQDLPQLLRGTTLQPLGWLDQERALVIARIDQLAIADAGQITCDSTGLYVIRDRHPLSALQLGSTVCKILPFAFSVDLSPEGTALAYSELSGRIVSVLTLSEDGGSLDTLASKCDPSPDAVAWSPSGAQVAFLGKCDASGRNARLHIVDRDGGHLRAIGDIHDTAFGRGLTWSPDGRALGFTIAEGFDEGQVVVSDTAGEHRLVVASGGSSPSWSPTGEWIAYLSGDSGSGPTTIRAVRPDGLDDHEIFRLQQGVRDGLGSRPAGIGISQRLVWVKDDVALIFGTGSDLWKLHLDSGTVEHVALDPAQK